MSKRKEIASWLSETIPALTLGLLLFMPVLFSNRTRFDAKAAAGQVAVAAAIEHAPYQVGRWVGADIPIPPAALRLLHPNAILSRRYESIDRAFSVQLLLVHCTDARDMLGHYPPVCYPSSGWSPLDVNRDRESVVTVRGRPIPFRMYGFRRIEAEVHVVEVRVLNVFILPDGTLTPDIDEISRLSERLALSAKGVAQMQIVTPWEIGEEIAAEAAGEILEAMPDLLTALRVWKEDADV